MTPTVLLGLLVLAGDPSPEPPLDLKRTPIKFDVRLDSKGGAFLLVRNDSGFDVKDVQMTVTWSLLNGLGRLTSKATWPSIRTGQVVRVANRSPSTTGAVVEGTCRVAGREYKFTASFGSPPPVLRNGVR